MIELTKINGETILINALQIEYVELIPESKVIMMNGKFHIVTEDKEELTRKVVEFMRASHKGTEWEA
ncbi:MAG: flagellar FlbD family protein [Firmicutes bacterium]|nr:flagellar FlbD family protein [Bacillota bacterium]